MMKNLNLFRFLRWAVLPAFLLFSLAVHANTLTNTYRITNSFGINDTRLLIYEDVADFSFEITTDGCTVCDMSNLVSATASNATLDLLQPNCPGCSPTTMQASNVFSLTAFSFDTSTGSIAIGGITFDQWIYFTDNTSLVTIYSSDQSMDLESMGLYRDSYNVITDSTVTLVSSTVSPVPVPAAFWLFGSGLLGLVGVSRRKAKA